MIVRISAVGFIGPGAISCRVCSRQTVFPDGAKVLLLQYPKLMIVVDAADRSTLHICGREYYWQCPSCGEESDYDAAASRFVGTRSRARRMHRPICGTCWVKLEQKSRPVEKDVD